MNEFDFKNRTAVITGGGQGFGLDIAKRFLDSGAKVIIWDIDEELLKSAVDEVNNPNLSYNVVDVSNYKQIEKTVSNIASKSSKGFCNFFLLSRIFILFSSPPFSLNLCQMASFEPFFFGFTLGLPLTTWSFIPSLTKSTSFGTL